MSLFFMQVMIWIIIYFIAGLILEIIVNKDDIEKVTFTGVVLSPLLIILALTFLIIVTPILMISSIVDSFTKK